MGLLKESRKELILIFTILGAYQVLALTFNRFPFQANSLFADSPSTYETFEFYSQGSLIPSSYFQMQNPYDGDPLFAAGRKVPTIYVWGDRLSENVIAAHLAQQKNLTPDFPSSLCLHRITWSAVSDEQFGQARDEWYVWDKNLKKIASATESADCPLEDRP